MNTAPTITVTGEATVPVRADRASLGVSVTVRDADQQACLRRRREAVAVVRRVLERAGALYQESEQVRESVSHERAHQATWSLGLLLRDATDDAARGQLVEVVSRLSGVNDCQVAGPRWSLSPGIRQTTYGRALGHATAEARSQAAAIAQSLGGRLTGVSAVRSNSHVPAPAGGAPQVERVALTAAEVPLPERSLDIAAEPATEHVTANVEAVFHAELPES